MFVEDEVDRELLLDAVALAAARGLLTTDDDEQLRALLSTRAPLLRELLKLQADHQRYQKNARRTPHALPVKTVADGTLTELRAQSEDAATGSSLEQIFLKVTAHESR